MTSPANINPSTPVAGKGVSTALVASATMSASGAWSRSSIVNLGTARKITFELTYTTDGTGGTDGYVEIVPMVAATREQPAANDATWFTMGYTDGTYTEGTLSGTLPSGTDFSAAPNFAKVKFEGLCIRTDPADADTDVVQIKVSLDVSDARWIQLMYHEAGDTANPGALAISYVLSS
jgi:hypothetical protein